MHSCAARKQTREKHACVTAVKTHFLVSPSSRILILPRKRISPSKAVTHPATNCLPLYDDLVARVNAMEPAFVVHLGDITDPVPVSPSFVDSAQAFHKASESFSMPYHLVPGNHDIGEKIHPALPKIDANVSITKRAIDQYEQHFGRQRYSFEHEGCLFLVINTMLINSGLEAEREQWDWLEETLSANAGKRTFVFAHYPLYLSARDEPDFYDNIDEPGRSQLIDLLKQYDVEGYYAGHVHNYFYNHLNGMHQFVLPSTGIIRADYMEFFRTTPTRDIGRFDPRQDRFFLGRRLCRRACAKSDPLQRSPSPSRPFMEHGGVDGHRGFAHSLVR